MKLIESMKTYRICLQFLQKRNSSELDVKQFAFSCMMTKLTFRLWVKMLHSGRHEQTTG